MPYSKLSFFRQSVVYRGSLDPPPLPQPSNTIAKEAKERGHGLMELHLMMDALVLQNLINKHKYMNLNIYTKIKEFMRVALFEL